MSTEAAFNATTDLNPPARLLLGPGPSSAHPRVLRAMATPLVGHLDPTYMELMDELQVLLRYAFQTENELTLSISGTGTAGMEAGIANLVEPGDRVVVGVAGYFGDRIAQMAARYGANVRRLEKAWGDVFSPAEIEAALAEGPTKLVALVHAETSSGALQPIQALGDRIHDAGALFMLDCVTSLGGVPVEVDEWGVDFAYSCSQKCLGCPPGLAPVTVSPRTREAIKARKTPISNFYLDLNLLADYWGKARSYHHTAPISMNYALREGLRLVAEEGLEARFARHQANAERLWAGLGEMDLACHVPEAHRLPTLTTVRAPEGVDEADVRRKLLSGYNIEVGGGLGQLKGQVWRVGLMGYSSAPQNVTLLLAAFREILGRE